MKTFFRIIAVLFVASQFFVAAIVPMPRGLINLALACGVVFWLVRDIKRKQ